MGRYRHSAARPAECAGGLVRSSSRPGFGSWTKASDWKTGRSRPI